MITDWKNKTVAVLGLGVEGLSAIRFLRKQGCSEICVLDKKEKELLDQTIVKKIEVNGVRCVLGEKYLDGLSDFDIILRTPGFYRNHPRLLEAEKKGLVVTSGTKIFFDMCPCPIIGITGTKGKGTTSSLIFEMLKASGRDVFLGGNIGTPPLDFLEKLTKDSIAVLELSSFQLQDMTRSPHIAVMLMTTSEHLDQHKDITEYIDAKRNILRFQTQNDFAVVNRDYPASNESDIYTDGKVFYVSRERVTQNGSFIRDGVIWIVKDGAEKKVIDTKDVGRISYIDS